MAQSIVVLEEIMTGIYSDCEKIKQTGHHGESNPENLVSIISDDLIKGNVFEKSQVEVMHPLPILKTK